MDLGSEILGPMPLLNLLDGQLAYGEHPLLDRASFAMDEGERIGLIGRNGTGKSSLLGAIAGTVSLDTAEIPTRDGLRLAAGPQEPVLPDAPTRRESLVKQHPDLQNHKLSEF